MIMKNHLDLSKQTAIITGGAGLLGKVYSAALLECGTKIIILDKKINRKKLESDLRHEFSITQKKIQNITLIECDITKPQQVKKSFFTLKEKLTDLKILINNASLVKQVGKDTLVSAYKPFLKMDKKDWEEYFDVDLSGTMLVTQNAIPFMQKNGGGSIINISSTYGILSPDQRLYKFFNAKLSQKEKKMGLKIEKPIGYSISKSGILNLTRFLATKFAQDNIRVNTLTLGGVYDNNPIEFVKLYEERTPIGRMANKKEYAGPLLFLASNMSSYMTGSNLIVDGGWSAW